MSRPYDQERASGDPFLRFFTRLIQWMRELILRITSKIQRIRRMNIDVKRQAPAG